MILINLWQEKGIFSQKLQTHKNANSSCQKDKKKPKIHISIYIIFILNIRLGDNFY